MTSPSSYIPTIDAPATRAADSVSRTLGSEYSPTIGTFFVDFTYYQQLKIANVLSIGGVTTTTRFISLITLLDGRLQIGSGTNTLIIPAQNSGRNKLAFIYAGGALDFYANGSFFGSMNLDDSLSGNKGLVFHYPGDPERNLGGVYQNCFYYPHVLTESELIALTTPETN